MAEKPRPTIPGIGRETLASEEEKRRLVEKIKLAEREARKETQNKGSGVLTNFGELIVKPKKEDVERYGH